MTFQPTDYYAVTHYNGELIQVTIDKKCVFMDNCTFYFFKQWAHSARLHEKESFFNCNGISPLRVVKKPGKGGKMFIDCHGGTVLKDWNNAMILQTKHDYPPS